MKKIINIFLCCTLALTVFIDSSVYADETTEFQHNSWGCEDLKVDEYIEYAKNHSNDTVIVAVLDSGVDYTHTYLKDHLLYNEDGTVAGYDFVDDDNDPMDDMYTNETYHGTHVAGIIADCTQDLDIKILPVRVLDTEGYSDAQDAADGIYYAVEQGASVINMSFYVDYGDFDVVFEAVDYAIEHNVTVVCSAGNEGTNLADLTRCPSDDSKAICVSNIDSFNDEYLLTDTSNYGDLVDFCAPGAFILSCKGGETDEYQLLSGTSMATPHIAACAAMLYLTSPDITPEEVEEILASSCLDLGDTGKDQEFGNGLPQMDCLVPEETVVTEEKSNTNYGIIAGAVLVIGAGVVVVYLKKRRK